MDLVLRNPNVLVTHAQNSRHIHILIAIVELLLSVFVFVFDSLCEPAVAFCDSE